MNIKTNPCDKPAVRKVVLELTDMEAGFLRTILYQWSNGSPEGGFAAELWTALDKYSFPAYDERYGTEWRELDDEDEEKDD